MTLSQRLTGQDGLPNAVARSGAVLLVAVGAATGYAVGPDGTEPAELPQQAIASSRLAGDLPIATPEPRFVLRSAAALPAMRERPQRRRGTPRRSAVPPASVPVATAPPVPRPTPAPARTPAPQPAAPAPQPAIPAPVPVAAPPAPPPRPAPKAPPPPPRSTPAPTFDSSG